MPKALFSRLFVVLIAVLIVGTIVSPTFAEENFVWEFIEVGQNPYDKHSAIDPEALYDYTLQLRGSLWKTMSGTDYKNLQPLLSYFRVEKLSDLVGKSFASPQDSAILALDYLLIQIKHAGKYTPSTNEELYERAARALSLVQRPDFSDVDEDTIWRAFSRAFSGFYPDTEWLSNFKQRIATLSNGSVELRGGDEPAGFKGPGVMLVLVQDGKEQKIAFGPYSTPFIFVK